MTNFCFVVIALGKKDKLVSILKLSGLSMVVPPFDLSTW